MRARIHHVALNVVDMEWYISFFQNVFEMRIQRTDGESPKRRVWFHEGVQLNECREEPDCGAAYDHFSLGVDDIPGAVKQALEAGCSPLPNGEHWLKLPNGVRLELKPL